MLSVIVGLAGWGAVFTIPVAIIGFLFGGWGWGAALPCILTLAFFLIVFFVGDSVDRKRQEKRKLRWKPPDPHPRRKTGVGPVTGVKV